MNKTIIKISSTPFAASPVQYKITSGNTGGAFGIHNSTGLIFIACALDYEKLKKVSEPSLIDSVELTVEHLIIFFLF